EGTVSFVPRLTSREEMEFVAPLAFSELRNSHGADQYSVVELVVPRLLAQRLHVFKAALRSCGGLSILDHFDDVYSFLQSVSPCTLSC
ncbi:unnamed protein product, partial [Lampetra planeri]